MTPVSAVPIIARFEVQNRWSQVLCDVVHQQIELQCLRGRGRLSIGSPIRGQAEIFCHQSSESVTQISRTEGTVKQ